jgi:hypothetical protein
MDDARPAATTRRAALRVGGAALVAAAFARPASAAAAIDEGALLVGLWRREMGASLAYDRVAHLEPLFVMLRGHETDHAAAIATELAAVGLGTPHVPQWVGEIDAAADQLARADAKSAAGAALALEQDLIALYRRAVPNLRDSKIAMTAATILASHSQHALILQRQTDGR